jgi:hypothetical protein
MAFVRFIGYIIATLAIAVVIFFGCWFLAISLSRAHIQVINQSGTTLSNLVISGSCKERDKDELAPLTEWHTTTPYHGPIQLSFVSNGKNYVSDPVLHTNDSGFCGIFFLIDSNIVVKIETRS